MKTDPLYIWSASREMGQGVTTAMPQFAAEALHMDLNAISVAPGDTTMTPYGKTTTSSRSTFHSGNAILEACGRKAAGARPVAGGTDVYVNMHSGKGHAAAVLDLKGLKELHGQRLTVEGLDLGL